METPCFLVERTGRARQHLRRYAAGPCPAMPGEHGYHNALARVEDGSLLVTPEGYIGAPSPEEYADDARWPVTCACGYVFAPGDIRQVHLEELWRNPGSGEELVRDDFPAGAMYDSWWLPWKGPDGVSLTVVLPDGTHWPVDGPEGGGSNRPWTRTGTPPQVTADPSIRTPNYHGWLRDGVLRPC